MYHKQHKEERKMKKNRFIALLAALPLLASCSSGPKAGEKPDIKFEYSNQVTFEVFADKVSKIEESLDWSKEDFKAPSYTMKGVDYQESTYKITTKNVVEQDNKSIQGSVYEGGYDSKNKVLYYSVSRSSNNEEKGIHHSESNVGEGSSEQAYQPVYFEDASNPTTVNLDVNARTMSKLLKDVNVYAVSTFVERLQGCEATDIVENYASFSDEMKAEFKFYVDGDKYTIVRHHEYSEENSDYKTSEKYDQIYQVEVNNSKFVYRVSKNEVESYTEIDLNYTEDSTSIVLQEFVNEVGDYSHKLIDVSDYDLVV